MNDLTPSQLLQYARVQMAAESLYQYDSREQADGTLLVPGAKRSNTAIDPAWLTTGNGHASAVGWESCRRLPTVLRG